MLRPYLEVYAKTEKVAFLAIGIATFFSVF